jgi:parallel beta helix pectate lyase-like protein
MKRKAGLFIAALASLGVILTTYSRPLSGTEAGNYADLGILLASQTGVAANPQNPYTQFFSEVTLTVTKEGDGFLPGTLRTILLQAAGIRHNNPFNLVKIYFDPSVKRVRVNKGNLPPIEEGLITIDCAQKVTLDGSLIDSRYLEEGESPAGLTLHSSGNVIKGCQFEGFGGHAIVLAGNRNQIRENRIGALPVAKTLPNGLPAPASPEDTLTNSGSGIYIADQASENQIESNEILGNRQDGITFASQTGPGNRIVGNVFDENAKKGIQGGTLYRTARPVLRPIMKEGDSYIISGIASDTGEIEISMAASDGKEGKMTIVPPFSTGRGDFSVSVKSKGFVPGSTKIVALATASGRNTSEFSDPVPIPTDQPTADYPSPSTETIVTPRNTEGASSSTTFEDSKESDSNSAKPLNDRAGSALSVGTPPPPTFPSTPSSSGTPQASTPPGIDPFLNAITIPQASTPPGEPTVTPPTNNRGKSGESDSIRVEASDVGGAP